MVSARMKSGPRPPAPSGARMVSGQAPVPWRMTSERIIAVRGRSMRSGSLRDTAWDSNSSESRSQNEPSDVGPCEETPKSCGWVLGTEFDPGWSPPHEPSTTSALLSEVTPHRSACRADTRFLLDDFAYELRSALSPETSSWQREGAASERSPLKRRQRTHVVAVAPVDDCAGRPRHARSRSESTRRRIFPDADFGMLSTKAISFSRL